MSVTKRCHPGCFTSLVYMTHTLVLKYRFCLFVFSPFVINCLLTFSAIEVYTMADFYDTLTSKHFPKEKGMRKGASHIVERAIVTRRTLQRPTVFLCQKRERLLSHLPIETQSQGNLCLTFTSSTTQFRVGKGL